MVKHKKIKTLKNIKNITIKISRAYLTKYFILDKNIFLNKLKLLH